MTNEEILKRLRGGLVVSCQALPDEPLHDSYIMSKMAYAALLGGACGIRANTVADIRAIKERVDLPIIGIVKREYPGCSVYITPTEKEVDELCAEGVAVVALDATRRPHPGGLSFAELFRRVRRKYPDQLFMADTSCFEEGKLAFELGCDLIGTTLCGYTEYTKGESLPALSLVGGYARELGARAVAEGGIWTPEQLRAVYEAGAFTAVVGTAITRPREIARRFVNALKTR